MVWFKTDDAFYSHPKVVSIPRAVRAAALGTWVLCGTWAAHQLTDGEIPGHLIEELGGSLEGAQALVRARLWTKTRHGWTFKSWAEYQPTRAEVEAAREAERRRKADYRARQKRGGNGQWEPSEPDPSGTSQPVPEVSRRDTDGRPTGTGTGVPPHPTRPDPTRPDPSKDQDLLTEASSAAAPARSTDVALLEPPAPAPARRPPASSYPPGFETFWAAYPRHEGKRKAATAWQAACRRASAEEIADGARRYRDDPNREEAYTAHPTTWLNRDGWQDAPLPRRRPESQQDRLEASTRETLATLHRMGVA